MIAHLIRTVRIRLIERQIAKTRAEIIRLGATHFLFDVTQVELIAEVSTHQAKLTSRRDRLARVG